MTAPQQEVLTFLHTEPEVHINFLSPEDEVSLKKFIDVILLYKCLVLSGAF